MNLTMTIGEKSLKFVDDKTSETVAEFTSREAAHVFSNGISRETGWTIKDAAGEVIVGTVDQLSA